MRRLLLVGLYMGCASAGKDGPDNTTDASPGDGSTIDAPIDAPLPCIEIMTELLANPAFDGTPMGVSWMQTPINPVYPPITGDGMTGQLGITEQSAPYQAWLGGLPAAGASTTDVIWQDVTIPARTRLINLSGFYEVRSSEPMAAAVDTATVTWVTPADAPIATVIALNNTLRTTTFTTLNYGLSNAAMYSGMTLRLKLTSTNNPQNAPPPGITGATSFFFDTFSVKATHCMP